jgi:hypothetical protein
MDVYYPSRQRSHKKFVEHVLEAYHHRCARNTDHVGQLAERWSAKHKERAAVKGMEDFYDAYFPNLKPQQQLPPPSVELKRKGSNTPPPERRERRC